MFRRHSFHTILKFCSRNLKIKGCSYVKACTTCFKHLIALKISAVESVPKITVFRMPPVLKAWELRSLRPASIFHIIKCQICQFDNANYESGILFVGSRLLVTKIIKNCKITKQPLQFFLFLKAIYHRLAVQN